MKYPEKIWVDELVGSNGIHCLDYKNDIDVMYIRSDLVNSLKTEETNRKDKNEHK